LLAARPGWDLKEMTRQFTKIFLATRDAVALSHPDQTCFQGSHDGAGGPVFSFLFPRLLRQPRASPLLIYDRENFIIPNHILPQS